MLVMVMGEDLACSHLLLLYCRASCTMWPLSEVDKAVMSKASGQDLGL